MVVLLLRYEYNIHKKMALQLRSLFIKFNRKNFQNGERKKICSSIQSNGY